jgi:mediator of RNA polymerase II transcription subunit 13
MLNLQIAYEGCRLGNHIRTDTIPEFESGLVPCKVSHPISSRSAFGALRETCSKLGKLLSAKHAQMRGGDEGRKIDAFVIYMVDPFEDTSAVWELCSAFWNLFQTYGQGPSARADMVPKPDLVLQIIPIKYIASFDVPVILEPSTYAGLAREVYDRCPPSAPSRDKTPLSIYAAPSFQLEEAIPRGIPFRLNSEPPQDLLRENSYIHLGYAISLDGSWITAAWTDNCGKSRTVVSYNLGTRPFGEIAKEIWQTTIEILQARRVTWRVCIAKCGVMDRDECEAWTSLTSCPTQVNLFITLLSVDPNPPLKFTPTMPPTNTSNTGAAQTNTPGSTPQPGISPDPHSLTPAATPSADNTTDPTSDPDARLVDLTDESWGIILSHRLHNTNSTVEFRPCLISGLLVKRGQTPQTSSSPAPDPERGPIVVGVNIIWVGAVNSTRAAASPFPPATDGVSPSGVGLSGQTPASPAVDRDRPGTSLMWTPTPQMRATAENLLKEVLAQFRALGVLAKLKGVRGSRMGTVPWHVAVAKRGVEGLGACVPSS